MSTLNFPSGDFPAPPAVAVEVPDDWSPAWVPGTLLAARQDAEPDRFAANLLVTSARYASDFTVGDALSLLNEDLTNHGSVQISEPIGVELGGGGEFVLVNVVYDDSAAGTLVQAHAYTSLPVGTNHKDVVHVIGTCAAVNREDDYPLLQRVMSTVTVAAAP